MDENINQAFKIILDSLGEQNKEFLKQTVAKDYLEQESEQLQEKIKSCEKRISTIKSGAPLRCTSTINSHLSLIANKQIDFINVLQFALDAKNCEKELAKTTNLQWKEKYENLVADYKKQYRDVRQFFETTNPFYKQYKDIDNKKQLMNFKIQNIKVKIIRQKKIHEQWESIKEKRLHFIVVNFVQAVRRHEKYQELSNELNYWENKKKETMKILIEKQLKSKMSSLNMEKPFSNLPIFKLPKTCAAKDENQTGIIRKIKKDPLFSDIKKELSLIRNNKETNVSDNNFYDKTNESKVKLLQNKQNALVSLKSTLNKTLEIRRAFNNSLNNSFKTTQPLKNLENLPQNKTKTSELCTKPIIHNNVVLNERHNLIKNINDKQNLITPLSENNGSSKFAKNFENLKNFQKKTLSSASLKLSQEKRLSQHSPEKQQVLKVPMAHKFEEKKEIKKNETFLPILKSGEKRKFTPLSQNDSTMPKKEKIVNFASPIEEKIDILSEIIPRNSVSDDLTKCETSDSVSFSKVLENGAVDQTNNTSSLGNNFRFGGFFSSPPANKSAPDEFSSNDNPYFSLNFGSDKTGFFFD